MNILRFNFIVSCLNTLLPNEISELIAGYTIAEENSIIIKMQAIFADNLYKLTTDNDYLRFYDKCLQFVNDCGLTYTEFNEWFDSGLLVGFLHNNRYKSNFVVYSLPNGEYIHINEVSFIFNYYDLETNSLQNVDSSFTPVCKYKYRYEYKYRYYLKREIVETFIEHVLIPHVFIPQISTREVYRYQRLESNFRKLNLPKASRKQTSGSRNRKMHR